MYVITGDVPFFEYVMKHRKIEGLSLYEDDEGDVVLMDKSKILILDFPMHNITIFNIAKSLIDVYDVVVAFDLTLVDSFRVLKKQKLIQKLGFVSATIHNNMPYTMFHCEVDDDGRLPSDFYTCSGISDGIDSVLIELLT